MITRESLYRLAGGRRDQRGVVGANLVVTIAFALYAVIMLSRVTLSAKQIDDRVRVIIGAIGPGSNVSQLGLTEVLDTVGANAEAILEAAAPLSGQAGEIIQIVSSIDRTVSAILANASEINTTVKSINGTLAAALPVVRNIHGDETINAVTGGVAAINKRAQAALPVVFGISSDLTKVFNPLVGAGGNNQTAHSGIGIHAHVNSIDCSVGINLAGLGQVLNALLSSGMNPGCNTL